ncbi:TIR domain-containing protein [Bradyrhizobium pachyrhizi]|uniref:TIR domain-containing protein n=1 Tax=Bradyrhizobium pachyrhizi TaxID=280333 RepID=UPI00067CA950|nr:TIR domain-containing protein [Bradyrhizobium pachyrhizi]
MKERFEGEQNRAQLIAALRRQEITDNNEALATALAEVGQLEEFAANANLIVQGQAESEVFLLLTGVVAIMVHGAEVATRKAGQHIGEMSAIDSSLPRAATVTARQTVVALKVSSNDFMRIGDQFSQIYKPIAQELARRLYQRNESIFVPNETPKVFIISSSESLRIAHAVRDGLGSEVYVKVWDHGVFFAGGYPLEELEREVAESDFAIAIAEPDDITVSRSKAALTVRDNVLFELGMFMGQLSRHRSILIHPKVKDLKLPSDLQGLTLISYESGDADSLATRIQPVCETLLELMRIRGVHTFRPGKTA